MPYQPLETEPQSEHQQRNSHANSSASLPARGERRGFGLNDGSSVCGLCLKCSGCVGLDLVALLFVLRLLVGSELVKVWDLQSLIVLPPHVGARTSI